MKQAHSYRKWRQWKKKNNTCAATESQKCWLQGTSSRTCIGLPSTLGQWGSVLLRLENFYVSLGNIYQYHTNSLEKSCGIEIPGLYICSCLAKLQICKMKLHQEIFSFSKGFPMFIPSLPRHSLLMLPLVLAPEMSSAVSATALSLMCSCIYQLDKIQA